MNSSLLVLTPECFEQLTDQKNFLIKRKESLSFDLEQLYQNGGQLNDCIYAQTLMELSRIDQQILDIDNVLNKAEVKLPKKSGVVDFGSRILLKTKTRIFHYMIVDESEADPKRQKISFKSVLGQALLGKKSGDKVRVKAPAGVWTYNILAVE